eukprot:1071862-Amphidinium_carterae.1
MQHPGGHRQLRKPIRFIRRHGRAKIEEISDGEDRVSEAISDESTCRDQREATQEKVEEEDDDEPFADLQLTPEQEADPEADDPVEDYEQARRPEPEGVEGSSLQGDDFFFPTWARRH